LEEPKDKPKFIFEPLGDSHDRAAFSCGSPPLDTYLQKQAGQDIKKNLAAVFICTADGKTIAGYYTLSAYSVRLDALPEEIARKLTRHSEVPATLIGRLARSSELRGTGLGEILLMDALKRSVDNIRELGSWAVIVDAKDADAVVFYQKYGFMEIPQTPNRLFLPMKTIAKLLS
jgi:predicted GNAT family N-acyltransferase